MPYSAKILLDSISPAGRRLTTWELSYPRFVHSEVLTHRVFSRNSASSRAIPNDKLRKMVAEDPALPVWWGKNQSGMQAREELSDEHEELWGPACDKTTVRLPSERNEAKRLWLEARDSMLDYSERLAKIGLHKQLCNRLIEPWMFITVIVTATHWDNWYHQRNHKDAQPEIAWVARDMWEKFKASTPMQLDVGGWHLPLVEAKDWYALDKQLSPNPSLGDPPQAVEITNTLKKVSVGRCARVSYLTHDGKRDLAEDIALHDRLLAGAATEDPLHMSPFEHVAECLADPNEQSGNFRGWRQYRKTIPGEHYGEAMP